ncbi:MAG: hypothetical protein JST89_16270 [Cyanobacteria bacterium SZAS-4]|nr:hypothetical protein [Cyanobacteria bacterium SZAS-4]
MSPKYSANIVPYTIMKQKQFIVSSISGTAASDAQLPPALGPLFGRRPGWFIGSCALARFIWLYLSSWYCFIGG